MINFIDLGRNMVSVNSINKIITMQSGMKRPNVFKRLYNSVPNINVASDKFIKGVEKFGEKCTSAHQRGILGVTALLTQPFIDAKNPSVDDTTRKYSVARTIAKIIAGTLTGVAIRAGCIKLMKAKPFLPKCWQNLAKEVQDQYRNAMGTIVSLVIMTFTNFLIDAPLTKFLTNVMTADINKEAEK